MWREDGTSYFYQWLSSKGSIGQHTHLVVVESEMWMDAPHEQKYASMIPT